MRHTAEGLLGAQVAMLAAQERDPDNPAYLLKSVTWIDGPDIDVDALRRAVIDTSAEVSVLRGIIHRHDDGTVVHIPDRVDPGSNLQSADFSHADDPDAAFRAWFDDELSAGVPLFDGVLARHAVVRIGPDRIGHATVFQHIAIDGYAGFLLTRRVVDLYRCYRDGEPATPTPFTDHRIAADAEAATTAQTREFWSEYLADPPVEVGFAAASARPSARRLTRVATLSGVRKVESGNWIHRTIGSLAAYTARILDNEALLGIPRANRRTRFDRTVPAMMMSVLPIRIPVAPGATIADVVSLTRKALTQTQKHSRIRGDELIDAAPRAWQAGRLYGPTINVLPFDISVSSEAVDYHVEVTSRGPIDDITMTITPTGTDDLLLELDLNPDLYSDAQADRHLDRIVAWLTRWAHAAADSVVDEIDFLLPADIAAGRSVVPADETAGAQARRRSTEADSDAPQWDTANRDTPNRDAPDWDAPVTVSDLAVMTGLAVGGEWVVCDSHDRPVPIDRPGEVVHIDADGIRERTGILVRVTENGWRYVSRLDEVVAIKGRLINLHEQLCRLRADERIKTITTDPAHAGLIVVGAGGVDPAALRKDLRFRLDRGVDVRVTDQT